MEEKKPLFDKPMAELREAFVRNWFGQSDVFGRPDIEQWLAEQHKAERPEEETWTRFLGRGTVQPWADRDFFDLRSHATALGVLNEQFGSVGEANAYGPIYDRLAFVPRGLDPKRGLYSGDAGMLYVEDHIHGPMFVVREEWGKDGGVTITRVRGRSKNPGARTILGVVFAEWQCGRPKWREARASLCRVFDDAITHERAKAEGDFDSAVAVSTDGTKIVHADWVVVFDPEKNSAPATWRVYRAEWFRKHKVLRHDFMNRSHDVFQTREIVEDPTASHASALQLWSNLRNTVRYLKPPLQVFVECQTISSKLYNVLIVSSDMCPLPEGGVEVTV